MAPELFDGGQVTEKVDVFSFGVLCWEMLTGQVPWGEVPSPMQIIYYVGVLAQRPPVPSACPEFLKNLIEMCWAESPAARPGFKEILARLKQMQIDAEASGQADLVMPVPTPPQGAEGVQGIGAQEESQQSGREQTMSSFSSFALHSYNSSGTTTTGTGTVEGVPKFVPASAVGGQPAEGA